MSSFDRYINKKDTNDELKELEDKIDALKNKTQQPKKQEEKVVDMKTVEEDKDVKPVVKNKIRFSRDPYQNKPRIIKDEDIEETDDEMDFDTKKKIIKRYKGETENRLGRRLKRKEKKEFMGLERENFKEKQNTVLILAIIGIFSIFFIYMYVKVEWALIIIIMYGIMVCLPIGMFMGFILLDPWWRCKILRKTTKRNYGIVFFVSKAQKLVTKIKDFDAGLIWKKNSCWVLTKSKVYQLSKDGEQIIERGVINPDKIIALVDTVPVIFVDLDSMEPLSLIAGNEPINPEEIGSSLKSWADNQLAKALFIKKSMDIYFVIIIIASVASAGLAYYGITKMEELKIQMDALKTMITNSFQYIPPNI